MIPVIGELVKALSEIKESKNDLAAFKTFLEAEMLKDDSKIKDAITGVQYSYNLNLSVYTKNQDGKITYYASDYYDLTRISVFAVDKANELLATEDYVVKGADKKEINTSVEPGNIVEFDHKNIDPTEYELILTIDDQAAFEVLCMLQEKGYNTDKLTTHFVPVITLGDTVDYKAYVVEQGKDKYEENKYLVDLTTVSEEDLEAMIYTTRNVISAGRLAGTVIADDDAIAGAAAKIVANLIKGATNATAATALTAEAVKLAIDAGKISTSLMQRNLGVGYGRAAKLIDQMEEMGYVSKPDGNKPRRVLITMDEYVRMNSEG